MSTERPAPVERPRLTAGILAGVALVAAAVVVGPVDLVWLVYDGFWWVWNFAYKAILAVFVSVIVSIIVLVVSAAVLAAILFVIRAAGSVR